MRIPISTQGVAWLLAAFCLALAIAAVALDAGNRRQQARLQQEVAAIQAEMQKVSGVENVSRNILEDLGRAAVSNREIRVLLARYGYSLAGATNGPPEASAAGEDGP